MYTGYYFTELIVKERQRQLVAEADRLRQIKAIKSKKNRNKNRGIDSITGYIKALEAFLFKKHDRLICEC